MDEFIIEKLRDFVSKVETEEQKLKSNEINNFEFYASLVTKALGLKSLLKVWGIK